MLAKQLPPAPDGVSADTAQEMDEETTSRLEADLLSGGVLDSAAACAEEAAEQVLPENGTNTAQLVQLAETVAADTDYIGEVCGISRPDTGYHFIFAKNGFDAAENPEYTAYGLVLPPALFDRVTGDVTVTGYAWVGTYRSGGWCFSAPDGTPLTVQTFSLIDNLFSRNAGLFESGAMQQQYALIVGCGSVGSLVARELAHAGVGRFYLVDDDVLKLHNICRHQLGLRDLGRYKVDAVADDIRNINPAARVQTFVGKLEQVALTELEALGTDGIVVGTADSRLANAAANRVAAHLVVPYVAIGCWSRCHAGEVFYWSPEGKTPMYHVAFAGLLAEAKALETENRDAHSHYFATREEQELLRFEPGTAVDLNFVTLVGIKVALDLLNRHNPEFTTRVLDDLTEYTLICNTNKTELGGENARMFPHPLFISHNVHLGGAGVNPIKEMIKIAHKHDVPFLVDAAQSIPHMAVDVQDLDADFLVFSGHKVYGPTGVGVLYGKEEWLNKLPPYQGGGEMIQHVSFEHTTFNELPFKFEAGTPDYIGTTGLAKALDYVSAIGLDKIAAYEHELTEYATQRLKTIPGMRIFGEAAEKGSVISFLVGDIHHFDMGTLLDRLGIAVRTGHHCAQPLMQRLGIEGTVRASFGLYNTREEVDVLVAGIERVSKMF